MIRLPEPLEFLPFVNCHMRPCEGGNLSAADALETQFTQCA